MSSIASHLTDNATLNTTFAYDATNKLTRTLPNAVVSTYQYDGLNRLTRLTERELGCLLIGPVAGAPRTLKFVDNLRVLMQRWKDALVCRLAFKLNGCANLDAS